MLADCMLNGGPTALAVHPRTRLLHAAYSACRTIAGFAVRPLLL